MRFIVAYFALFALAKASVDKINDCGGVTVSGINHEIQILKENVDRPYHLAIDYDTNTLFFSFTGPDNDTYISARLDLKTNEYGIIADVKEGFAHAVDHQRHIVYVGGEDGVYKYDYNSKTASNLNITGDFIGEMFFKDGLYFTTYPSWTAYLYKSGEVRMVPELINITAESVAVDNDNNIFYSNSSGLFCYKRTDDSINEVGNYVVIEFTSDVYGNLYFATTKGIFTINEKTKAVEQLAAIDYTFGLAIEADGNIIYAADDSVVRFKSTGKACATED